MLVKHVTYNIQQTCNLEYKKKHSFISLNKSVVKSKEISIMQVSAVSEQNIQAETRLPSRESLYGAATEWLAWAG